jgi:hypothetical protein
VRERVGQEHRPRTDGQVPLVQCSHPLHGVVGYFGLEAAVHTETMEELRSRIAGIRDSVV